MKPEINIQEPFKKTWNEPQIIISRDDIIEYEKSQLNQERLIDTESTTNRDKLQTTIPQYSNSVSTSTNEMAERLQGLRSLMLQAEFIKRQLTPRECDNTDSGTDIRSKVSSISDQDSDWLIPELTRSRSLPTSPLIDSVSHITSSPRISSNQERYFSFCADRLRDLEAVRLSPDEKRWTENDEADHGCRTPHRLYKPHFDGKRFDHDCDLYAQSLFKERFQCSPARDAISRHQEDLNAPLRAKRKLDMDADPQSISLKRTKTDLAQEAGIRYISQLEMDLLSLKHRLHYASPEMTTKPINCACAEMEKHFMEMATSAYKSIRRYDGTLNSFDRFKHELTQTNQVIKDSMELLQNVRRLCVH